MNRSIPALLAIAALTSGCAAIDCAPGTAFQPSTGECVDDSALPALTDPVVDFGDADDSDEPVYPSEHEEDSGIDKDSGLPGEPEPLEPTDPIDPVDTDVPDVTPEPTPTPSIPVPISGTLVVHSAEIAAETGDGEYWDWGLWGTDPDAFLSIRVDGDEIFESDDVADSLSPTWDVAVELTINPGQIVDIEIKDWDITSYDDSIATFGLSYEQLSVMAGAGPVTLSADLVPSFVIEFAP